VLQILYPHRLKENYDQIELEFISFSKNRITRELVQDHIAHLIQSENEPNYRFFLKSLRKFDYQNLGTLKLEDYDEAISQIMPSISRLDKRLRYKQSEALTKPDAVPLERLAQISSYLLLYTSYSNRWISNNLLSREFLDMFYKNGIRDEDSDVSDEDLNIDTLDQEKESAGIYSLTEEEIELEVKKLSNTRS
jgi:hypothetical protein